MSSQSSIKKSGSFGHVFLFRYLIFLLLTLLYSSIIYLNAMEEYSVLSLSIISSCFIVLSIAFLGKNLLGFNGLFVAYLTLTHLGIPIVSFLSDDIFASFRDGQLIWYYSNSYSKAVAIADLGICSFLYFTCIFNAFITKDSNDVRSESVSLDNRGPKEFYYIGITLIIIFTLYLLYNIFTGRIEYSGNYQDYHASLSNLNSYSVMLFLFAIGMIFSYSTCERKQLKIITLLVLIPAILLVLKGNRGEVLYPLTASLAVLFKRGIKLDFKKIIALGIFFFICIPLIKDARAYSLNELAAKDIQIQWTDSFVEIGYTLRPLVYTVEWIDSGEELAMGRTYVIPVQRIIATAVPVIEKMDNRNDRYSFRDRLPTMGYSVIAEAFFNFGKLGVVVIMALLALLLNYLGDRASDFPKLVFTGGLLTILINNIRNAFSFVPGQTVILMIFVLVCLILRKKSSKKDIKAQVLSKQSLGQR